MIWYPDFLLIVAWWRWEIPDFTDVAAVVITAADSRSGILALLKRTGFIYRCFCIPNMLLNYPRALRRVINGNEQQWLELESAARQYEENLLPPFYDTLTQYVEMGNSTFGLPRHQHGAFLKSIPPDAISLRFLW